MAGRRPDLPDRYIDHAVNVIVLSEVLPATDELTSMLFPSVETAAEKRVRQRPQHVAISDSLWDISDPGS